MAVKFKFETLDTAIEADWPVLVSVPADGGKVDVQEFVARLRFLTKELLAQAAAMDIPNADLVLAVLKIEGEPASSIVDGKVVPSPLMQQLLDTGYARIALIGAYAKFCNGVAVKN